MKWLKTDDGYECKERTGHGDVTGVTTLQIPFVQMIGRAKRVEA